MKKWIKTKNQITDYHGLNHDAPLSESLIEGANLDNIHKLPISNTSALECFKALPRINCAISIVLYFMHDNTIAHAIESIGLVIRLQLQSFSHIPYGKAKWY